MKLLVTFRDTEDKLEDFALTYKIRNCSLSNEWVRLLIKNGFRSNHPIEKTYCLHGWQTTYDSTRGRNLDYLCKSLNKAIKIINENLSSRGYHIDLEFTVNSLKDQLKARDLLNDIHHHFELLIGQVWNPSKWYEESNPETKYAIRLLNNLCHEIEANIAAINNSNPQIYVTYSLNCPGNNGHYLDKERQSLTLENYNDFLNEAPWGSIILYYSQLGKRHIEAFDDKDEYIDKENISGYRYITGEFILMFENYTKHSQQFLEWLKINNYDVTDKTLGIDYPVLANVETSLSLNEIKFQLKQRDDLYKIELIDDTGTILHTKVYDYTWKDQEII
jgi:hypothetical protein